MDELTNKINEMFSNIFNSLPYSTESFLAKKMHDYDVLEDEIYDRILNKKLSKKQMKQITSVYDQMKKILEEILNNKEEI